MEGKESPATLALRAPPRPVTRLNRRTLLLVVGAVATAILGATLWSLQPTSKMTRDTRTELHNVDRVPHAEGLAQLPTDYGKLAARRPAGPPVLGEPLPGDLGGPLLRAEQQAAGAGSSADAARAERLSQEREAEDAAKAPLFFPTRKRTDASTAASRPDVASDTIDPNVRQNGEVSGSSASRLTAQEQKLAFLDRGADQPTRSPHRLQAPASPYQVMAGTVIAAALLTGINADLPGKVMANVTEPVYDSATGRSLLIPQGSRLLGEYDSQVVAGQRRVLLAWTRIIFPDTTSLTLDRLPGVDAAGYAGLEDGVDRHWGQLLAGAALSTLLGIGAELAAPDRGSGQAQVIVATRQGAQDSVNQVGQALTRRNVNTPPTLTVRPGFPVRVIVAKDLLLPPYHQLVLERSR
jgi:type IV secretory pathway VirB10-like protein